MKEIGGEQGTFGKGMNLKRVCLKLHSVKNRRLRRLILRFITRVEGGSLFRNFAQDIFAIS